jgi:superfamily II DNA/RNA helicase
VVFSQWRRMLKLAHWAIGDLLGHHRRCARRSSPVRSRSAAGPRTWSTFHDDPTTRVLFATDAGGVGLNLQKAASCCINLDLPWNPAVLEQRIARVHRFGQTQPVDVYALVAEGGIEARIAGLVADKKALFRGLFDGTATPSSSPTPARSCRASSALIDRPEVPPLDDSDDSAGEVAADMDDTPAEAAVDPAPAVAAPSSPAMASPASAATAGRRPARLAGRAARRRRHAPAARRPGVDRGAARRRRRAGHALALGRVDAGGGRSLTSAG